MTILRHNLARFSDLSAFVTYVTYVPLVNYVGKHLKFNSL